MRKAVLIAISLAILASVASPQRRRAKPKPKPDTPVETPCGIKQSIDEFIEEIKIEWRIAAESADAKYYYNTTKMMCDGKVMKIWVKAVRKDTTKLISYSMHRYEVNCRNGQLRQMSNVTYEADGSTVDSATYDSPKWADVVPDSVGEGIWETVCRKPL